MFYDCRKLESIYIPSSINKFDYDSLSDCASLKDIYFEGNELDWNIIEKSSSLRYVWPNVTIHYNSRAEYDSLNEETATHRRFKYYQSKETYLGQDGFSSEAVLRNIICENILENLSNPIPGIINTDYINKNGTGISSIRYIPQGICRFGDYYIISAYFEEENKEIPSVFYVLDSGWNLMTTFTVDDYSYHNGGMEEACIKAGFFFYCAQ